MTDASASPSPAAGSAVMASVTAAHFGHARTFNSAHLTSIRFGLTLPAGKIVATSTRHGRICSSRSPRAWARAQARACPYSAARAPHPSAGRPQVPRDE
jgi:hypothetical protein